MQPAIILFAKAPVAGRVKTRLIPPLTPDSAARLHAAFVSDMLDNLKRLSRRAAIELHTDIDTDAWAVPWVARRLQHEGDLGLRMLQALRDALQRGHGKAMIVGSDAPTLPVEHLIALMGSEADVALGPARDGGYYAISCSRVHADMFKGVTWSAPDTLRRTVDAAERAGLSVELGPEWYDVDTIEDIETLRADPGLTGATAAILERSLLSRHGA